MHAGPTRALDQHPFVMRMLQHVDLGADDLKTFEDLITDEMSVKRRRDLIAMVPAVFSHPDIIVTLTGVLELLGAIGLLLPALAPAAAACLALLLIAMFPANVRAARERLRMGRTEATPLPLRTLIQIAFIAALLAAGFPGALHR